METCIFISDIIYFFNRYLVKSGPHGSIFWDKTDVISFLGWTSHLGPTGSLIQHKIVYFFDINMVFANYLSMAYRLVCIFGGYEFTFFKQPKYFYLFAASMFIISHTLVFVPLFFDHFSLTNDQVNDILTKDWPALLPNLSNVPSLFGYSKNDWAYNLHICGVWLILVCLLLTIIGVEIYMIPCLKRMKKVRSDSTFKLQVRTVGLDMTNDLELNFISYLPIHQANKLHF